MVVYVELIEIKLKEGILRERKDDLENKLSGIDQTIKADEREKTKDKIFVVLKFYAYKGRCIDWFPYLGKVTGFV